MTEQKRLILVSGLSGAGKTIALHVLEDLGYYCIDNLPATLLESAVEDVLGDHDTGGNLLAVGIDARNRRQDLESLPRLIESFRAHEIQTDVLFLLADDEILLKRFGESRRRHPMARDGEELRNAIKSERDVLAEVINAADLIIDTSPTSIYELGDTIRDRVDRRRTTTMSVLIESFGFKHGIPADADFVFDLRCLPNPYWTLELRGFTGLDEEVSEFLESHASFGEMHDDILRFLTRWIPRYRDANRGYLTVALGCTGGRHRSVYMVEKIAASLADAGEPASKRHNHLRH